MDQPENSAGKAPIDDASMEDEMLVEWINIQIMECEDDEGAIVTIFRQSDGDRQRYVLGNGHCLAPNPDGTFSIPKSERVFSVMSI